MSRKASLRTYTATYREATDGTTRYACCGEHAGTACPCLSPPPQVGGSSATATTTPNPKGTKQMRNRPKIVAALAASTRTPPEQLSNLSDGELTEALSLAVAVQSHQPQRVVGYVGEEGDWRPLSRTERAIRIREARARGDLATADRLKATAFQDLQIGDAENLRRCNAATQHKANLARLSELLAKASGSRPLNARHEALRRAGRL